MQLKGFTLLETSLVLLVSCFIFWLGFTLDQQTVEALREENFFRELRAEWAGQFYRAIQKKLSSQCHFFRRSCFFFSR